MCSTRFQSIGILSFIIERTRKRQLTILLPMSFPARVNVVPMATLRVLHPLHSPSQPAADRQHQPSSHRQPTRQSTLILLNRIRSTVVILLDRCHCAGEVQSLSLRGDHGDVLWHVVGPIPIVHQLLLEPDGLWYVSDCLDALDKGVGEKETEEEDEENHCSSRFGGIEARQLHHQSLASGINEISMALTGMSKFLERRNSGARIHTSCAMEPEECDDS
jgi:hypothetical protein